MPIRLMHRTVLLVGAAGHAGFGRGKPAFTLREWTADPHDQRDQRRRPEAESQHTLRMLTARIDVKSAESDYRASEALTLEVDASRAFLQPE
jgi:hypothetical protein